MTHTRISRRGFGMLLGAGGLAVAAPTVLGEWSPAEALAAVIDRQGATKRVSGPAGAGLEDFDSAMFGLMTGRSIPCGQLAIMKDGRLVLARGYTYSDNPDLKVEPISQFRIASLSKLITAAAICQLAQNSKLGLHDPVTAHLDLRQLDGGPVDLAYEDITIIRLLQHLGGWDRDITPDPTYQDRHIHDTYGRAFPINRQDVISYGVGLPLDFTPGERYAYSNLGYWLLGEVVAAASGLDATTYVQSNLFDPMGISRVEPGRSLKTQQPASEVPYSTHLDDESSVITNDGALVPVPYGAFNLENKIGSGEWIGSAVDYVRFTQVLDDGGGVLDHDIVKDFMLAKPETYKSGDTSWYGFGTSVHENGNTWHSGGLPAGTRTIVTRRASDNVTWAVLFNQCDDPSGLSYDYQVIADAFHNVANGMDSWPDVDYFPDFF